MDVSEHGPRCDSTGFVGLACQVETGGRVNI